MDRRMILTVVAIALLGGGAMVVGAPPERLSSTCKWKSAAIRCSDACVEIVFQDPAVDCSGSTVDVEALNCAGGSWTTIATNVTSPARVNCGHPGSSYDYRLVMHCSCGGNLPSPPLGCSTCP